MEDITRRWFPPSTNSLSQGFSNWTHTRGYIWQLDSVFIYLYTHIYKRSSWHFIFLSISFKQVVAATYWIEWFALYRVTTALWKPLLYLTARHHFKVSRPKSGCHGRHFSHPYYPPQPISHIISGLFLKYPLPNFHWYYCLDEWFATWGWGIDLPLLPWPYPTCNSCPRSVHALLVIQSTVSPLRIR